MTSAETSRSRVRSRDAELMRLGQATGELMHDLAGLLSVLNGRVALVREEAANGNIATEELARLQNDSDEIRRMVVDILDDLRGSARSPEIGFTILPTLEDTVNRWMARSPAVPTTLHASVDRDAWVIGPRTFFSRAVGNLLRNAARHARTEVRLTLAPDPGGRSIEVRVEDDGRGIPPELAETLFDPFVTSGGLGTGLGLSFARWGAERLGGTLNYMGRAPGLGGAHFQMILPLAASRKGLQDRSAWNPTARHTADPHSLLQGFRIALLDDEPAIRNVYSRLLRRTGAIPLEFAPEGMTHASAAVALIRCDPDVILLDLDLGDLRGDEILLELQSRAPALVPRTLLLSGRGAPGPEPGHPMVNKLVEWPELADAIHRIATGRPLRG